MLRIPDHWTNSKPQVEPQGRQTLVWLDSDQPLADEDVTPLVDMLNSVWADLVDELKPPQSDFSSQHTARSWIHIGLSTLLSALPSWAVDITSPAMYADRCNVPPHIHYWHSHTTDGATRSGWSEVADHLRASIADIVLHLSQCGYNIVVSCELDQRWLRHFIGLTMQRLHRVAHIQVFVKDSPVDTANDLPDNQRGADFAVANLTADLELCRRICQLAMQPRKELRCSVCVDRLRSGLSQWSNIRSDCTPSYLQSNDIVPPVRVLLLGPTQSAEYCTELAQQVAQQMRPAVMFNMMEMAQKLQIQCGATTFLRSAIPNIIKSLAAYTMCAAFTDCNRSAVSLNKRLGGVNVLVRVNGGNALKYAKVANMIDMVMDNGRQLYATDSDLISVSADVGSGSPLSQSADAVLAAIKHAQHENSKCFHSTVDGPQQHAALRSVISRLQSVQNAVEEVRIDAWSARRRLDTQEQQSHQDEFWNVISQCVNLSRVHVTFESRRSQPMSVPELKGYVRQIVRLPTLRLLSIDAQNTGGKIGKLAHNCVSEVFDCVTDCSVEAFSIYAVNISTTWNRLVAMLRRQPTIRQLSIKYCDMGVSLTNRLVAYLRKPECKLEYLTIWQSLESNEQIEAVLAALSDNTSLISLTLDSNNGYDSHALTIAGQALRTNTTLQQLQIRHDHLHLATDTEDAENFWQGEVDERVAFAEQCEQYNTTLLSCNVFDAVYIKKQEFDNDAYQRWFVGDRPCIPRGQQVLRRNQLAAGHDFVDASIKFTSEFTWFAYPCGC